MDGGAWWAKVHGVAKIRTRLSDLTYASIKKKKNRREERARRKEVNEGTHDSRASKHKASLGYWDRPETSCQSLHFPLGDVIKSPWNLGEGCLWVIQ